MSVEIALAALALLIAAVGTLLRNPSPPVKIFLIILAILTFGGSVIKSINEESDKKFMQTAIISNLIPSNSSYEKLSDDVDKVAKATGFDEDTSCHHNSEGMICLLSNKNGDQHAIVVLNKLEIAEMYANQLKNSSNQKVINEAMQKSYDPKNINEEFMDKVGILGFGIYFNMFYGLPLYYSYDPKFGVIIAFDKDGKKETVEVGPSELSTLPQDKALNLFHRLGESFREKFKKIFGMSS